MPEDVRIGTCGFRGQKHEYAELLSCVEIQHTFYNPPQVKTLEKWSAEMPEGFEFTLKAWQLITHESTSPTYRRLRRKLTEKEADETGFFKPTEIVDEAWQVTRDCAVALGAQTVLFQCPAKFKQTAENLENIRKFFERIDRGGLNCGWEPRGPWDDEVVREVCEELDLWHVVDPFKVQTVTPERCYYRLHGVVRWRYTFEDGELDELVSLLPERGPSYVFFNNITMTEDAVRFGQILREVRA
ncbi:MAG: DUF72 domain-containing protein [Blastocatellia bacterium]|nr:DUF72 domain-containing protein [Blastocatellia bacterium]